MLKVSEILSGYRVRELGVGGVGSALSLREGALSVAGGGGGGEDVARARALARVELECEVERLAELHFKGALLGRHAGKRVILREMLRWAVGIARWAPACKREDVESHVVAEYLLCGPGGWEELEEKLVRRVRREREGALALGLVLAGPFDFLPDYPPKGLFTEAEIARARRERVAVE